jgi:HAE1 family hydrophobic/amphiphilic exporter-1
MFIRLKKGKERITNEKKIFTIFDQISRENPGAEIEVSASGSQLFGSGRPVEIKIYGEDLDILKRLGAGLVTKLGNIEGLKNISSSMEKGLPEFTLTYNREKIAKYGLTVGQISQIAKIAINGQIASIYRESGEEVDIVVRLKSEDRKTFKDLLELPIASPLGFVFPLRDVVQVSHSEGPGIIERENAKRQVIVSADITDRKLSSVVNDVTKAIKQMDLPTGYFYEFGGQEKDRQESFKTLFVALLMSLLLVYMILASLYESLIHPFTIMLSVPFAFTGAIFALYISGIGLGVTAFIGLIMLIGIVVTNAVVMIDFIIKRRAEVKDRRKAIVEAASIRLRPILMTAIATLFALLPVALGRAEGMELQIPLGVVVVGGLFSSTFLTLFIVPVVYEIFDSLSKKKKTE